MKKVILIMLLLAVFALSGCCSCESYYTWRDMGPVPEKIANKAFWSKECKNWAAPLLKRDVSPPAVTSAAELAVECESNAVSKTYPSSDVIRLEKKLPKEVQLGTVFDYSIKVTNLTDMTVGDVVVTERLPGDFVFTEATPAPDKAGSTLTWTLGSLAPKGSEEIKVSGSAASTGCLTQYAYVTYSVPACASVKVVQAELKLEKSVPAEVLLCDPIQAAYEVTNAGTGSAGKVTIVDKLPEGLLTEDGKDELTFDVGTLGADQSKQFKAMLKASEAGRYANKAIAESSIGLKTTSAEAITIVRQPVLTLVKRGPTRQYLGRPITYEIVVANTGDGVAKHTTVEDTIPPGVTSIKASEGGAVYGSKVVWELGTLEPNHSEKVSITYTAHNAEMLSSAATATAYCAPKVTAKTETSVVGIPAILLEVVDIEDPIEVGNEVTYVITATNQGSAPGTNIHVVCLLEGNEKYVSSSGATAGMVEGNIVTFEPLASLAPKDKATWRVTVKAMKAGHVLFRVSMTTDEFTRPVQKAESTNLY